MKPVGRPVVPEPLAWRTLASYWHLDPRQQQTPVVAKATRPQPVELTQAQVEELAALHPTQRLTMYREMQAADIEKEGTRWSK